MELLLIFTSSILPIFIIISVAFIYNRLLRPDIPQIANIVTMVFGPVFVFDSLMGNRLDLAMLQRPFIFMCLLTLLLMLISSFAARIINANEDEKISLILAGSMINVGNFGLPLIFFAYGEKGEFYSILNFAVFNLPLSTVAIYLSSKERQVKKIIMDVCKIPIFYTIVLALIFSHFSVHLPKTVNNCIELTGAVAIPLLIFVLGLQLSNIEFKVHFIRLLLPTILIRLIISPLIAWIILTFLAVSDLELKVAIVQTSAPAALLPLLYSIKFSRSPDLLAAMVMITTLFSGFTLTILIRLLG